MAELGYLSRRERQIMEIVFALGEASATQVVAAMPDAPSRTSVRTILRILEEKGQLRHRVAGREYVYRPVRARAREGLSALRRVLATFFEGSLEKAVAAHLADAKAADPQELRRMLSLIHEAKQQGR